MHNKREVVAHIISIADTLDARGLNSEAEALTRIAGVLINRFSEKSHLPLEWKRSDDVRGPEGHSIARMNTTDGSFESIEPEGTAHSPYGMWAQDDGDEDELFLSIHDDLDPPIEDEDEKNNISISHGSPNERLEEFMDEIEELRETTSNLDEFLSKAQKIADKKYVDISFLTEEAIGDAAVDFMKADRNRIGQELRKNKSIFLDALEGVPGLDVVE